MKKVIFENEGFPAENLTSNSIIGFQSINSYKKGFLVYSGEIWQSAGYANLDMTGNFKGANLKEIMVKLRQSGHDFFVFESLADLGGWLLKSK